MDEKLKIEHWLYLLFVASLPFPTLFQSKLFGVTVLLPDLLFLTAAVTSVASMLVGRELPRFGAFHICLALYAIAMILSTVTSANLPHSAAKLVGKFYLIGIAALTCYIINSVVMLQKVVAAWTTGAAVAIALSLIGILLFYLGVTDPSINLVVHPIFGSLPPGNYPRIEGFFAYPAMLCNFLGVSWMFLLLSTSLGWMRTRSALLVGSTLLIVNAFTLTPGFGGIFLSTAFFLRDKLKASPPYATVALGAGVVAAAAFLFVATFTLFSYDAGGTGMPLATGDVTLSHRARAWQTSLQTFSEFPIFGRGVGMPIARSEFIDPSGNRQLLTDAHNTYVSVLGETGLLGFVTFMGIVIFVTLSLFRWRADDAITQAIRLCLILALADSFFYQGLTGSYEDTRHLWVVFGMAAATTSSNFIKKRPQAAS